MLFLVLFAVSSNSNSPTLPRHATYSLAVSMVSTKSNKSSQTSEKPSWALSLSRSISRVHSPFSLHTRLTNVLEDDNQDAFDPHSRMIKIWDHLLLLSLLLEAFLIPYLLAFEPEAVTTVSTLFSLLLGCESIFLLDLYVQAQTGYYSDGNLIRDTKLTVRRYMRSLQFLLDLVAILPSQGFVVRHPNLVAKFLLVKLIRWSRVPHFVSSLDELYAKYFVALKLFKVLAFTVYLAHVQACVRFCYGHAYGMMTASTGSHHGAYLASLFWSVGIMTGLFEGELPHHSVEFVLTIVVALCGFSMFTTLCATIFVISKCESGQTEALDARIHQLIHVLSFHHVPENQQTQAVEYLKRYYSDTESHDRETAKLLCPSISTDIQVELLQSSIAQISIFQDCSEQFIVAMTSLLEMIALPAQTTLFTTGDDADALYVVHSGVLVIVIQSVMVRELRKGACFGELSVFSSTPRTSTAMSSTYVILYKLSAFHCQRVLEGYPECASLVARHVLRDREKNTQSNAASASTRPLSATRRTGTRHTSIAKVVAGASALVRALSTSRKCATSSSRRRLGPWSGRKSLVSPGPTATLVHESRGPSLRLWKCIDHHSRTRMWWLLLLLSNLCYCWLVVPVQVAFPLWQRPGWWLQAVDSVSNAALVLDLVLNFRLSFTVDSEKITDANRSARRYLTGSFVFDLLCALPYEYVHLPTYGLLRLPRLLGIVHLRRHLTELASFLPFNSKRQLLLLGLLLFLMFHVVTCIHFTISYVEGFNPHEDEAWISPMNVCLKRVNATHLDNCHGVVLSETADRRQLHAISMLQYARSLYYAVGVLASPGKSVEPTTDVQLVAALVLMLSGFLITAVVVDNVQKRVTASAYEQKEFFATSTRIQLFLRRQNAPLVLHHRVKSFLDYWWSSHRGAVLGELLADLPRPIRLDLLKSICFPIRQTLALLQSVRPVLMKLEEILVANATFTLYGQGEIVYRHGDSVIGLFFLLEGDVCVVENGDSSREVPRGAFFGTAALTQQERGGEGYTEHVSATSGCILLLVSRDQLDAMETVFPTLKEEFLALEQRFLGNKLSSMRAQKPVQSLRNTSSHMFSKIKQALVAVHDPDSLFIRAWETWVFLVMTLQWTLVMFQACYPIHEQHKSVDAVLLFLELSFVVDMPLRARLGFYEFGNKIMEPVRIERKYLRSGTFVLDLVALLPLYSVNFALSSHERWHLVNVNKLLRLFKVPRQLHALETKYLKHTTELRLFKLLYYIFMLSHFLGCIWFNFASRVAVPSFVRGSLRTTAFGENHWLPSEHLAHGPHILQYMASLYWSFGLMSASSEPEFPKTTTQCLFSAATMTTGFFLFAYVIGNFTDIIELKSAETREFSAKMRSVRKMLDHFELPETLQQRVTTFQLFKRYHSISQEGLLVHCLPPSLLTDVRLVHLKPMIEKVEFLRGMEGSITRMLVSQFSQVVVSRGEFVCTYGESGSDMFFIFAGVLDILVPSRIATRHCNTFQSVARSLGVVSPVETEPSTGLDPFVKVNELAAGQYLGENGFFTNGKRDVSAQAQTTCILYRLSRHSIELVFARYPKWKQKVLRIAKIRRDQERLLQLSRQEQRHEMASITGLMRSRADLLNERAERLKDELEHARFKHSTGERVSRLNATFKMTHVYRFVVIPLLNVWHGLIHGVPVQTTFHLMWLRFMVFCTMYVAMMIPYQLSMDAMNRDTVIATTANALELLCEVAFLVDIWFNWQVQESLMSLELYEQNLRSVYKKERMFFDVVAAIPFYGLLFVFKCRPWIKLLHCVKIVNVMGYLDEMNRRSVANELTRFCHVWMMYLVVLHWAACAYLAVATEMGFATEWDSWLPSQELEVLDPLNPSSSTLARRFLRGLFFATTAFVKKARNVAPETASLYAFQIAMSFVGLFTMSFVIGELASLFISYIGLEVDFRKNHIAVELYLTRLRVSDRLKSRTYAYMTSLWSSHAGVNYDELFEEMPRSIRLACVLHASKEPLEWFIMKVITPVCGAGNVAVQAFTLSVADHLRFEGYPRDENVVTEGNIVRAMYFVTKGHLKMQSNVLLDRPVGLRAGSYFGERGLLACTISAYTVRTVRACDLFSLSSEALTNVLQRHSFSRLALDFCHRAYKQLTAKNIVTCSKQDMEELWGEALLQTVQETRKKYESDTTSNGEETAMVNVEPPVVLSTSVEGSSDTTSRRQSMERDGHVEETTKENEHESAELEANLDMMRKMLTTAEDCFEAFAPLLHMTLAADPLDWKAAFATP